MMKPKLTFGKYIITLLLTISICAALCLSTAQKVDECESILENKETAILSLTEQVDIIEQQNGAYQAQLDTLTAEISTLREEVKRQDKPDRSGERPRYNLTDSERELIEKVVMAESGGESYEGQVLVCQCILNACEINSIRPAEAIKQYAYAKSRPEPSDSVKRAVTAVFDRGEKVESEPIVYFYAPKMVKSEFHESQRFVLSEGNHKFFAAR